MKAFPEVRKEAFFPSPAVVGALYGVWRQDLMPVIADKHMAGIGIDRRYCVSNYCFQNVFML